MPVLFGPLFWAPGLYLTSETEQEQAKADQEFQHLWWEDTDMDIRIETHIHVTKHMIHCVCVYVCVK